MRKALAEQEGVRKKFRAIFVRTGKKTNFRGYSEETILLKNIIDVENESTVADHIWFAYSKRFQEVSQTPGACITFEARIKKYNKGYSNARYKIDHRRIDYKLSNPTKISLQLG
jgi:hypothetical protein